MTAVLVVKQWNGHRVGATIVLPTEKAILFELTGCLRILSHQQREDETDQRDEPMKKRRS